MRHCPVREGFNVFGSRLTSAQLSMIGLAVGAFLILWLVLYFSRAGVKLRAIASDVKLAEAMGLNTDSVRLGAMIVGSALAGLFGTLLALDLDVSPGMGLQPLMMGIVAVVIGGIDRVVGIMLGALMLGAIQNLGVWFISSQWQDAAALTILLAFLLCRPQGILGKTSLKTCVS